MNNDVTKIEITPGNEFEEKITPKKIKEAKDMFLFQCPKDGNTHYVHAGYVCTLMPFVRADKEKNVSMTEHRVLVCVKCKSAYIWLNEQMHDITSQVDMEKWEELKGNKMVNPSNFQK